MIEVLRKIWRFAGEEQGNIRKSMVLGFFYAIFHMFQIGAIYVVVLALVDGSTSAAPAGRPWFCCWSVFWVGRS